MLSKEILFNWDKESDLENYEYFLNTNNHISQIIIFDFDDYQRSMGNRLILTKQRLKSKLNCGKISKCIFQTNLRNIVTSKSHNSCLNRKISIDVNGDIKNCPSMPESYGNIKDTTLEEALNKPGFKKYWNITKDDIEVCRDCEFRYICTDCRAYTERTTFNKKGLDLSKPLKCGYNPYTNKWAEWSKNPLKQKAISYYGMEELVKTNDA